MDIGCMVIKILVKLNKTFYYWHIFIKGIGEGQLYGYRVYGDQNPSEGMRFDGTKVLVDPYANAVVSRLGKGIIGMTLVVTAVIVILLCLV